jgi:cob(I)alamin adenosyltransferase
MKIYTRTGDGGESHLVGGAKVAKNHARIEAYGTVDELNSFLGVAVAAIPDVDMRELLAPVQLELFDLGAELANPEFRADPAKPGNWVGDAQIARMEREIDWAFGQCPELKYFIVPGGSPAAAHLQVARTVCRRAERRLVTLQQGEAVRPECMRYLNRLSDLLFALARLANVRAGVADVPWKPASGRPVFHIR